MSINIVKDNFTYEKPLHPYHIVASSPWPILTSSAVLALLSSTALWFNNIEWSSVILILGFASVIISTCLWFRDIVIEGTIIGLHTRTVQASLSIGVSLFILTEAILFFSIFWSYFHSSLSPTIELGNEWPAAGLIPLSAFSLPLINTILLLSSASIVTWAHHSFFKGTRQSSIYGIVLTIILAAIFIYFQSVEYSTATFSISDGVYGSCFYFSTGGHGLHVFVGTILLIVSLGRIILYHYTKTHHFGLEAGILYWHFVDFVWIFLYIAVYWWGSD